MLAGGSGGSGGGGGGGGGGGCGCGPGRGGAGGAFGFAMVRTLLPHLLFGSAVPLTFFRPQHHLAVPAPCEQ